MTSPDSDQLARGAWVIGVTGGVACGKSTVLDQLSCLGAQTIDADSIYHDLIRPRTPLTGKLIERFGTGVADSEHGINRQQLAAIVFRDQEALAELERLTHPVIRAAIAQEISASSQRIIAVDAVKLLQGKLAHLCDEIWLVTCNRDTQIKRVMNRNGIDREDAERRVNASPTFDLNDPRIDVVLVNDGSTEALREEIRKLWSCRRERNVGG